MPEHVAPALAFGRLAGTAWLDPGDVGADRLLAEVHRFTRRTWRLPSNVPASCAHHALSPRFPARSGLSRLVRTLSGRFIVVNYAPAAALSRSEAALVRGIARATTFGLPAAPWPAAPRGGHARWPADGRRAHEQTLAAEWLARRPALRRAVGRARRVAVALYETSPQVVAVTGSAEGAGRPGAPGGGVAGSEGVGFAIRAAYHVVLLVDVAGGATAPGWATADAAAAHVLSAASGHGTTDDVRPRPWFAGRVLLPDAVAMEAMDAASRRVWARITGRLDAADSYWFPESWARFLEPGRRIGCVAATDVWRSRPGQVRGASVAGLGARRGPLGPTVERGLCVPPGYCLTECAGTLDLAAVVVRA